jgi:SAM-dependent methyltransferase
VSTYLLDHGWSGERERLDGLGSVFDPGTFREFDAIGVGPGWRCLEVGGGSGTVARWLCERVGPAGRVVATDLDTGFLDELRLPNLEVRRHDIVTDELEQGAFDLVHTRLVLEHLRDRDLALARMVSALAPGGWLVVEAFQYSGVAVTSSRPSPAVRRAALALPALFRAVLTALRPAGFDARLGHRLPAHLCRLGLVDVTAEGRAVFIRGGSPTAEVARLSLARFEEIIADPPAALPSAAPWTAPGVLQRLAPLRREMARRLHALAPAFDDDGVWAMAPLLVAARGQRPPGSP